jgi:hypothetical protein
MNWSFRNLTVRVIHIYSCSKLQKQLQFYLITPLLKCLWDSVAKNAAALWQIIIFVTEVNGFSYLQVSLYLGQYERVSVLRITSLT